MSLENELVRLNATIEALVGAIAANTSVVSAIAANAAQAPTAASAPKITANKRGAKTTTAAEQPNDTAPAAEPAPVAAEAAAAPAPAEAPQAAADPFGDEPSAAAPAEQTFTLDDVREYGLKLRDAKGVETAKKTIESFGVTKLAEIPPAKFAAFIRKCISLTAEDADL